MGDGAIVYIHITEKPDQAVKYVITENLEEISNYSELYKFRKVDIKIWANKIAEILRKELNAAHYKVIFKGSQNNFEFLKKEIIDPDITFHYLCDNNDFTEEEQEKMLTYLASIGNSIAADMLHQRELAQEDTAANSNCSEKMPVTEEFKSIEPSNNRSDAADEIVTKSSVDELEQKKSVIESDDSPDTPQALQINAFDEEIFEVLNEMKEEELTDTMVNLSIEELSDYTVKMHKRLPQISSSKIYIKKLTDTTNKKYKYLGIQIFFDEQENNITLENGEVVGRNFGSLTADFNIMSTVNRNKGTIIYTIVVNN